MLTHHIDAEKIDTHHIDFFKVTTSPYHSNKLMKCFTGKNDNTLGYSLYIINKMLSVKKKINILYFFYFKYIILCPERPSPLSPA